MKRWWILIVLGMSGCAILSEEEIDSCKGSELCIAGLLEDKEFERAERQAEREDKIRDIILECKAAELVIVYRGRMPRRGFIDRTTGVVNIPKHSHPADFSCVTGRQVQEAMRNAGLAY